MTTFLSPGIKTQEVDLSQYIPNSSTSAAALVGSSPKGSLDVTLITTSQQFIQEFCVNNKVELGNYFHYSALAYLANGNALYCKRVVKSALYGGMKVKTSTSPESNSAFSVGASSQAFATVSGESNLFYIFGKDPGSWNNSISVSVDNSDTDEKTFDINVYYTDSDGNVTLMETWNVSRVKKVDGYGQTLYLEDKINGYSSYIVVKDDTSQSDTVMPKENSSSVTFVGGSVGSSVTSTEISTGWGYFTNPDEYNVQILINGGWADSTSQTAMKVVAEARKDCICVFDIPYASIDTVAKMVTFRNTTQDFNSSYCSIYGPWLKINDSYNSVIVSVPPSGYVAGQMAYNDSVGEVWDAAAGYNRGVLNVLGLSFGADTTGKKSFTDGELDTLYVAGVNPIQKTPALGIAIWGQKTEQVKASATDRLNVRRSLIVMEKAIKDALKVFLFEVNSEITRFRVTSTITEYLDRLAARGAFQQEGGDKGFLVVCDTSNNTPATIDANELHVDVYVKPARTIEFILLRVVITKTGANLAELSAKGVTL